MAALMYEEIEAAARKIGDRIRPVVVTQLDADVTSAVTPMQAATYTPRWSSCSTLAGFGGEGRTELRSAPTVSRIPTGGGGHHRLRW